MRKIETINQLMNLGLRVAEVREFSANELDKMIAYANHLNTKYGTFNVRTDSNPDTNNANFNLPFIRHCTISKLLRLVKEYGDKITYLVHQDIPTKEQLFNGVLRLCDGKVIGEINDVDKTSLRQAMKNTQNVKQVCSKGNHPVFNQIRNDLMKAGRDDAWFELSAYKDGSVIYWQIVPEELHPHVREWLMRSPDVTA